MHKARTCSVLLAISLGGMQTLVFAGTPTVRAKIDVHFLFHYSGTNNAIVDQVRLIPAGSNTTTPLPALTSVKPCSPGSAGYAPVSFSVDAGTYTFRIEKYQEDINNSPGEATVRFYWFCGLPEGDFCKDSCKAQTLTVTAGKTYCVQIRECPYCPCFKPQPADSCISGNPCDGIDIVPPLKGSHP